MTKTAKRFLATMGVFAVALFIGIAMYRPTPPDCVEYGEGDRVRVKTYKVVSADSTYVKPLDCPRTEIEAFLTENGYEEVGTVRTDAKGFHELYVKSN